MERDLTKLTDLVIADVMKQDIVLPSLYRERFEHFARAAGINVDDPNCIDSHHNKTVNVINTLMRTTRRNADRLQQSTDKAQIAIQKRDEQTLEEVHREVDQLKEELQRLKNRLYSDPLTGKYNRMWINDHYLLADGTFPTDGTLAFIDLDGFKQINETHGSVVGEKVLIYTSSFLDNHFGEETFVRYAGDVYLLLSERLDVDTLTHLLRVALEELDHKKLRSTNGEILKIGFSYGVAAFKRGDVFREVIDTADESMLALKAQRRES